jgi:hypothetical protein
MAATRTAASVTAKQRAHALLRSLLSQAEYAEVVDHGYLTVRSPTRSEMTYRIPRGPGFVRVFAHDQPVMELCIGPVTSLPWDDLVVMHKLLIESDETTYLTTANHFPPRVDNAHMLETIHRFFEEIQRPLAAR